MTVTIQRPGWRVLTVGQPGVRITQPGGAGNGLLNALIAYWPGNEANGNAQDAHTNALHLTDVNTVTSDPGLVYATARKFTQVNNEGFSRNSEALLQTGGASDFTFAIWLKLSSAITPQALVAKRSAAAVGEFTSFYGASNRFEFFIRDSDWRAVTANTFGLPSTGVWYLVIMRHISVSKTITISVNAGVEDTTIYAGIFSTTAATFGVGNEIYSPGSASNMVAGPVAMWKSAAGGGGALTAAQRTALYNGGLGLAYTSFTS